MSRDIYESIELLIQVIVVAIKNRKLSAPKSAEELHESDDKESVSGKITHSEQFRLVLFFHDDYCKSYMNLTCMQSDL